MCAMRVISGFRTISDEAPFVIAVMLPIDIYANEMDRIYDKMVPNRLDANDRISIKEKDR